MELSGETAGRAIAAAEAETDGDDIRLDIDYAPGGGAYPLVMATYEVVCSTGGSNPELLRDFLGLFASETAQVSLEELGYAPLPGELRKKVSRSVSGIR